MDGDTGMPRIFPQKRFYDRRITGVAIAQAQAGQ